MKGLKIEEVAVETGVSIQTLNRWYQYKRKHPEEEWVQALPDYVKESTTRGTVRLWQKSDIIKIKKFQLHIKQGRNGMMGKYHGKGTKNGTKEN